MENVKKNTGDVNAGLITFAVLHLTFYINPVNSLHAL